MTSVLLATILAANWWPAYGDPELNRLVEKALERNLDLEAAAQRIAEARAVSGERKSKFAPDINATTSAQRLRGGFSQGIARIPQASGAEPSGSFVSPFETGLLQGGLDMKWELDLFGSNRRGLEAAKADVAAEEERRKDLAITVSAEVARYYFTLRGIEERLGITRQNVAAQKDLLGLTKSQVEAGLATQLDLERQALLLANTEATLPQLEADLAVQKNRLAVLAGEEAVAATPIGASTVALQAPETKGGIASELLKRRPDVRAAEARMAAAQARLKQARTDLFPKINLNGLVGRQGTSVSGLSFGGGNFFSIGPQLQLPIFNGGRIRAQIAAQDARLQQEEIAYRNEILTAFEEAANALSTLERQREREAKLNEASQSARTSLELSLDLYRAGASDFLAVLDSQRSVFDADYQRSGARTQVLVESVALYKALGGEWLP